MTSRLDTPPRTERERTGGYVRDRGDGGRDVGRSRSSTSSRATSTPPGSSRATPTGCAGSSPSPFLHAGFGHLIGNTIPFLVLGAAIAVGGLMRTLLVTAIVVVVGGLGTWLTAPSNTVVIGASGLVFGYATYLVARGAYSRTPLHIVGGLVGAGDLRLDAARSGSSRRRASRGRGTSSARSAASSRPRVVHRSARQVRRVRRDIARRIPCHARADGDGAAPGARSRGSRRGGARARLRRRRRRLRGARDRDRDATPAPAEATATPAAPPRARACGSCGSGASRAPVYVTAPPRRHAAAVRRRAGRPDHGRAQRPQAGARRSSTSPRR